MICKFAPFAAFLMLAGLAGAGEAAPRCDAIAKLHRSMFQPMSPATAAAAREHLHAGNEPDLGDADTVIRFFAPPGFGGDISTWTTARRVNGVWQFVRDDHSRIPPPPPPPPEDFEGPFWDMRRGPGRSEFYRLQGRLEPDRAAVLEAALNDPCLAREPDLGPAVLQLRSGKTQPCFDGAPFFLQIETVQGVRTFVHLCETRWLAGSIMRALEGPKGVPGEVTRTRELSAPEYLDEAGQRVVDPSLIRTTPLRIRVSGDYAGRVMTITIAGRRLYDSAGDSTPASSGWLLYPPINPPPGSMLVTIDGCDAPAALDVPDFDAVIGIHQCRVELDRDAQS